MLLRPSVTIDAQAFFVDAIGDADERRHAGNARPAESAPWQATQYCVKARWPCVATARRRSDCRRPRRRAAGGRVLDVVDAQQRDLIDAGDEHQAALADRPPSCPSSIRPGCPASTIAVAVEHRRMKMPPCGPVPFFALRTRSLQRLVLLWRQQPRVDVVHRERLPRERRRLRRERLRRPRLLARHVALRRPAALRSARAARRSRD